MKIPEINRSVFSSNISYLVKCVVGVIFCYLLYKGIPQYPFYWAIVSVVIALSPDNSDRLAIDRMKANILGCAVGLGLYPLHLPDLPALCIGVVLTILIGTSLGLTNAIRSAMAALVIVTIHEREGGQWYISLERVCCVVAGCLVALIVTLVFNVAGRRMRRAKRIRD
jgi:uncharacterized membrane protein YgaE (UPF0421/DUF939 family)